MLEISEISVFYGDIQVVFGLSLRVGEGEIVTLIGSNGAGKSTIVNTISGILRPSKGEILYRGKSIARVPAHRLVEQGLVQVPEGRMLFTDLTVEENLRLGSFSKSSRKHFPARLRYVFQLFPILAERRRQTVNTMSGGEQQMLAIGRALMASPKLLILDEPSIGLAPMLVAEVFRVIRTINEQGVSILLIEQNAIQALQLSSRGYVLEQGHMVQEGEAAELLEDKNIKSAYLGI
ncbi:MAG: ABC transporter ATP-binding protein [SAR324 cluster bacterium]|nr:ABC transporter ATP-binding protein [SAR324 cluster bacterium]